MDWKNRKKFSVLKMIAIELATTSSLNLEKDTLSLALKVLRNIPKI